MANDSLNDPDCMFLCLGSGCPERDKIRELVTTPLTDENVQALERLASYCKFYDEMLKRIIADSKS